MPPAADRLRELLGAVLDEEHRSLDEMAGGAHASAFHFSREVRRGAGEPPVAMRRRVMLERAAWQLRRGHSVTDAAWTAGYDSVEGFSRAFSRAFGHLPSEQPARASTWLPAPNGIHFHPPASLWVQSSGESVNALTDQLVRHDLDDTAALLDLAKGLDDDVYREPRRPGDAVLSWSGEESSIAAVLGRLVFTKEIWLAAIEGGDMPPALADDVSTLVERWDDAAPRWLETVRDIERRGAWGDRLVDALCDPPESFVISSVVAHVLTYSAARRQALRQMLREAGVEVDDGDPIMWLRAQSGERACEQSGEQA